MTPHYSGTTLDAQARYAQGTKDILENYFTGKAQKPADIIVGLGKFETSACSCSFFFVPLIFLTQSFNLDGKR